jgi:hypothetical protein
LEFFADCEVGKDRIEKLLSKGIDDESVNDHESVDEEASMSVASPSAVWELVLDGSDVFEDTEPAPTADETAAQKEPCPCCQTGFAFVGGWCDNKDCGVYYPPDMEESEHSFLDLEDDSRAETMG